jgi:putative nucleotidyltransferase with HDIG domain
MRFSGLTVLVVSATITTFSLLLVVFAHEISWHLLPQILLFAVLIVIAAHLLVHDPAGGTISSATTLFYVAIYVFNPITALFTVALGHGIGNALPRNWVTWRVFFNAAQMGISAFGGAMIYRMLGGNISAGFGPWILPAILGPITHHLMNNFFVAAFLSQSGQLPLLRTWVAFVREFLWSNLLTIPTAILIGLLYVRVHPVSLLLFLVSLPFQRLAIKVYLGQRETYLRIIGSLVKTTELGLPGTKGHSRRVADLSVAIARELGLSERDVEIIEYAALLHDVGMIGFDDMLASGEAYSRVDYVLEEHAVIGAEVASELPRPEISDIVRSHHKLASPLERMLRKRSLARTRSVIVALAEEVDSRIFGLFPYREPQSLDMVLEYVIQHRSRPFDAAVVDAFLRVASRKESLLPSIEDHAASFQVG